MRGPELPGQLETPVDAVDHDHGTAVQTGELGADQARHALAEDGDVLPDVDVRVEHGVQRYGPDPREEPDYRVDPGREQPFGRPPFVGHVGALVAPGPVDDLPGRDPRYRRPHLRHLADLLVAPP